MWTCGPVLAGKRFKRLLARVVKGDLVMPGTTFTDGHSRVLVERVAWQSLSVRPRP